MSNELIFKVYNRRHGHYDNYRITRTTAGWDFHHLTYRGSCDKQCAPVLFKSLRHDIINYPEALGDYLEFLWEEVEEGNIPAAGLQAAVSVLAYWTSQCEQSSPAGVFAGFK